MQAQRAGNLQADTATLFPGVAKWKKPAYTEACQDYLTEVLEPEEAAKVNLEDYLGYFEAGSAFLHLHFSATAQLAGAGA